MRNRGLSFVHVRHACTKSEGKGGLLGRDVERVQNDRLEVPCFPERRTGGEGQRREGGEEDEGIIPCISMVPARSVNLRCCIMAFMASVDGAQWALFLRMDSSAREARMETTTDRLSGCSGLAVLNTFASPRWESAAAAASIVAWTFPSGAASVAGEGGMLERAPAMPGSGLSLRTLIPSFLKFF